MRQPRVNAAPAALSRKRIARALNEGRTVVLEDRPIALRDSRLTTNLAGSPHRISDAALSHVLVDGGPLWGTWGWVRTR